MLNSTKGGHLLYHSFVVVVRGLTLVYSALLVFLLLVPTRSGVLSFMQSRLNAGFAIPEKNYGDVCSIYIAEATNPFANVTDRLDMFVLAHSIGWFIKAMIVRDTVLAWTCSVLFELVELSFAHLLANFNECWWDSIIMDVLGCNLIGIHLASMVVSILGMKRFNFFKQFGRKRKNFRPIFSAFLLILLITVIDLNYFFLKFILSIPNTHWLCVVRTLLWIGISVPSAFELFEWSKRKHYTTLSSTIGATGLALEMTVCYKFSDSLFAHAPPTPILAIVFIVSLLYATCWAWVKTIAT